jgi:hypothetical protein
VWLQTLGTGTRRHRRVSYDSHSLRLLPSAARAGCTNVRSIAGRRRCHLTADTSPQHLWRTAARQLAMQATYVYEMQVHHSRALKERGTLFFRAIAICLRKSNGAAVTLLLLECRGQGLANRLRFCVKKALGTHW